VKKRRLLTLTAGLVSLLITSAVLAAPSDDNIPTLFHNDEAWYKDETAPALLKDGIFHVPGDFIAMFDYITVTSERDGENLLLVNEQTGDYISILYSSRAACVNGKVVEDISIFRENGYYYLDADFISQYLGLSVEYSAEENITDRSVRVYDSEKMMDFSQLLAAYTKEELPPETEREEETPSEAAEPEQSVPRINLICRASEETAGVLAWSIADRLGMEYSLFLTPNPSIERLRGVDMHRVVGLAAATAEEADAVNEILADAFFRKTHLALTTGSADEDKKLLGSGYIILKPDFSTGKTTDAAVLLEEILRHADEHGSAVVLLGDAWQSETLLLYLQALSPERYDVGGLRGEKQR